MKGGNKLNKGIKLNEIELSADFLVGSPRFLCGLSGFLMSTIHHRKLCVVVSDRKHDGFI